MSPIKQGYRKCLYYKRGQGNFEHRFACLFEYSAIGLPWCRNNTEYDGFTLLSLWFPVDGRVL
jgi:hypothetical protein